MKPVYLEFCGVNSFSEKACIDFKKLFASGVFGVFGDTGSGKSTILDCIQLALYGSIDRSTEIECINRKCDGLYVVYDFELHTDGVRKTYRVRRERTRKTSNNAKAFLYEYGENGGLLALAEGTRDVNALISELIGLSVTDFKMCIALPQGEFAGLVKSKPADRLALVSRLFDLGKYGERLKFYLKEKCGAAAMALTVVETKLNALDDCGEEKQAEAENKLKIGKETLLRLEERYAVVEKETQKAETLLAEKTAYEKSRLSFEKMQKDLPVYEFKRKSLERYPTLKGIEEKFFSYEKAALERERAQKSYADALLNAESAKTELKLSKKIFDEGDFDEKINQTSRILGRFENAKEDLKAYQEAERALEKSRAEYNAIKNAVECEPFDEIIQKLNEKIEKLGNEESVTEYIKNHLKDAILLEGYGQVRADLKKLAEKYPETQEDVAALIKKYTLAPLGSEFAADIVKAEMEFKLIERERKQLKEELSATEKRKNRYEENESKKRLIAENGKLLRISYDAAKAKLSALEKDGTLEETTARFKALKEEKRRAEERLQKAQERERIALAEIEKRLALQEKSISEYETALKNYQTALTENGFLRIDEVKKLLSELGDESRVRAETEKFFTDYGVLKSQLERVDENSFKEASAEGVYALKAEKRALDEEKKRIGIEIGKAENELKKLEETKAKYLDLKKEYEEKKKTSELWERLRACVSGRRSDKTLMDFIATEYLQDVCVAAGKTLLSLTGGRYFLRYTSGEFFVGDNLDGGELRAVKTLSGGETFLVSLSLALSLSAAICQKSLRPIEFFFLDEGFGTLDEKLVETVMDVLGRLGKTFTIGLISHVEELKHRIENKILVTGATETRGSQIRIESF